jgi:hypothetical protein
MNFDNLLSEIQGGQEKVASAATTPTADNAAGRALQGVLEKTAAPAVAPVTNTNPVDALLKVATDLAENEKQAELLHASACGHNFANAATETWAAADAMVKSAQLAEAQQSMAYAAAPLQQVAAAPFQKVAAEVPNELLKEAVAQGYQDTAIKLAAEQGYADTHEKIAAEDYAGGQQVALKNVQAAAAAEFFKGAQVAEILIQQAQSVG